LGAAFSIISLIFTGFLGFFSLALDVIYEVGFLLIGCDAYRTAWVGYGREAG